MVEHFVVVGAQRCGTSYLSAVLDEHPEIEMAKPAFPEPKFFLSDTLYERGPGYYRERYFSQSEAAWLKGEKSTSYIESDAAAKRIAAALPDARIVAAVRDPVARAVSNYRFTVAHGLEDRPIDAALREALSQPRPYDPVLFSVSPYAYLERGRYVDHLLRYAEHFPRERMHVVVFEELVAGGGRVAAMYRWLGVDPGFRPTTLGQAVNASVDVAPILGADLRSALRDYFREPTRRLEEFLGRPLGWDG